MFNLFDWSQFWEWVAIKGSCKCQNSICLIFKYRCSNNVGAPILVQCSNINVQFVWLGSGMRMGCHKRRLQISLLAQQKLYCPPPFWELCGENFRLNAEKIQIFHVLFWIRNNTALLLFESQQVKGVHLMFVRFSAVWRKIHIEPKIAYWAEIILPSSFSCQKHLTYKTLFTPGPKALEALSASCHWVHTNHQFRRECCSHILLFPDLKISW